MASAKGSSYDYGLRLYRDILKLEHLHFGLWDDSDPRTIEGVRIAQERYMQRLLDRFPDGVETVLDVGAGTGALSFAARDRGYAIEALSPCEHQAAEFAAKADGSVPFHCTRFQDFEPPRTYDLVVCSESAQYVPLESLFERVRACLGDGGHFLVCDYFRLQPERFYRNCHVLEPFLATARANGFEVGEQEDVTEQVLPTLEVGRGVFEQYVLPVAETLADMAKREKPRLAWLAQRLAKKQLGKVSRYLYEKTPAKLDPERFRREVRYQTMLFKLVPGAELTPEARARPAVSERV